MNLPAYFIADLPPEASLSAAMVREACQTLKRNREQYLANRPTADLVEVLSETAAGWLDPNSPFRGLALEEGPARTGFSAGTLARGLDAFFGELTSERLQDLLLQELGHGRRLDTMVASSMEERAHQAAMASGPELLCHIAAGTLPVPTWMSMVLGLLVRSAQFVKCARGTSWLPRLFAHSLYRAEPKLASCIEIAEWRGGDTLLEGPLFDESSCVTATGTDETLIDVRRRLPLRVRFLGYGHRVSFAYVTREALGGAPLAKWVSRAADDVVAWNQLGCLSPHVFYAQRGGAAAPAQFAAGLALELARREAAEPRGPLPVPEAATITSRRELYQVRAAAAEDTRLWHSDGSTAWTVVYEEDPRFQLSCLNRFVYVKAVMDLAEALRHAEAVRGQVSTVGLAGPADAMETLATMLAHWGVGRVCPVGQMQRPPLHWRHDGRPALGDLVAWTGWEKEVRREDVSRAPSGQ